MNKKILLLCFITAFTFGCNNVVDVQEPDTEVVPETAISAIKTRYPDAGQFVFKTLIQDKLWKAKFFSRANSYETQISPSAISGDVFINSNDASLYKGLTDKRNDEVGSAELFDKIKGGFTDFNVPNTLAFEAKYDDLSSIRYVFQRKSGPEGTRDFISEIHEVFVNGNSGEVIFEQYSSYVYK